MVPNPSSDESCLMLEADNPLREFVRAFGLVERVMQPYFQRFGVTASQWGMLRTLYRALQSGEEGLRLTDLSDRLLVRPPSVTSAVARLRRAALISREPTPDDRRSWLIRLTPKGLHLVERVLEEHQSQLQRLLSGLDASQQDSLFQLMRQWSAHLQRLADAASSEPASNVRSGRRQRNMVRGTSS
jgi:DNA-binding MarR family transcriptional regulator